jgi:hypothetical protein
VLVVFNILRSQGFGSRAEPRRQVAQKLGIVDKYIDVLTETVSVASHEHGAAAECPVVDRYSDFARRVDQDERTLEQQLPTD